MKYPLTILLLLFFSTAFAQQNTAEKKLIQFSGLITDVDSNSVVPYVTVTNLSNKEQRYAANYKGFFSFIAHPGDTILYTAVGYKDLILPIPTDIADTKYTAAIRLKSEIVNLPTVEDFTRDFMTMKIADDDYLIAVKNLSRESISALMMTLPRDAGEVQSTNFRLNHWNSLNKNMVQSNPLLNPFAWGKLLESISKGDKSRSSSN
jgi:hypothetical protein